MRLNTPPSSIHGEDELMNAEEIDDDELVYVGDLDEVLEAADNEENNDDTDSLDNDDPPVDNATLTFNKHVGSVFCGSIHPLGKIAVTGGEDDKAYVWDIETGNVLLECTNHEDSVIIAAFSHDGAYLATADMVGNVKVRKCASNSEDSWTVVWDYQAGDLSWGHWHPNTRVLLCGAIAGEVYIWKIPSGDTKVLQGHGQKSECGSLLRDGRRLAVGYEDGSLKIWDLKSASVIHHISPEHAHSAAVTAIDTYHDNNLIISGSLDGKALLTKSAIGKSVGVLDAGSEIESISFCKDTTLGFVAVGTLDGSVSIWDIGRQTVRHKCSSSGEENATGVTYLLWINNYLLAACLDGSVKVYEGKSGTLVQTLTGHRAEILDISYSIVTNTLLTTSEDGTSKIFKLDLPKS